MRPRVHYAITAAAGAIALTTTATPVTAQPAFGPANPFYAPSSLPFQAPPFDKIQDSDYQPAIEAGMVQQLAEIRVIADNPEPATFENTVAALEKSGRLLDRVNSVFDAVTSANTNPDLQKVQQIEAPKLAAHNDAIFLDSRLYHRVETVYEQRKALHLDPESLRLIEFYHREFVHAGANLSDADKTLLKEMNEEISTLQNDFKNKLLAATQEGAYVATEQEQTGGVKRWSISSGCGSGQTEKAGRLGADSPEHDATTLPCRPE